jgi:hypothetical protein
MKWGRWRVVLVILGMLAVGYPCDGGATEPTVRATQLPDSDPPPDLVNYVRAPDDSFRWKKENQQETEAGTVYTLDLYPRPGTGLSGTTSCRFSYPKVHR